VLDGNERAIRFYERHGWVADGGSQRETLHGATIDEIRFRRAIGPS
jgi:hypothetical protein